MIKARVFGAALVALLALGAVAATAAPAAPVFLLAEWLLEGNPIVTPDLVEMEGELNFIDLNGGKLGVVTEVLCSGFLDGTVGPESQDLITELLNLAKELVSATGLSGLELVCTNTKNCENPKWWDVKLPWETELELMENVTGGPFFADLILSSEFTMECTTLGIKSEESCTSPEIAVEMANAAGGVVTGTFSDSFQVLAGLKLGGCGTSAEVTETTGTMTVLPVGGGSLTVSSGP